MKGASCQAQRSEDLYCSAILTTCITAILSTVLHSRKEVAYQSIANLIMQLDRTCLCCHGLPQRTLRSRCG